MTTNIDEFLMSQKLELQEEKNRLGIQKTIGNENNLTPNSDSLSDKSINNINLLESDNLVINNLVIPSVVEKEPQNLSNSSIDTPNVKSKNYEMSEQWVTDQFFSNFPSLSNQIRRKEVLVQKRHEEYQQYLRQIASKSSAEIKRKQELSDNYQKNKLINEISNGYLDSKITPSTTSTDQTNEDSSKSSRYHIDLLENLKHTDFSGSTSHRNIIEDRNTHMAEQVNRKKMEYHRDLIKQIEDKKREVEALRARDKAEEERLTKRLEEQLKSMHLEDELRKEKARSEQIRITNEQNHVYRMHLLSKLENDRKLYNEISLNERKAISENGKDKLQSKINDIDGQPISTTPSDSNNHKIYKYFSNSANYPSGVTQKFTNGGRTTPHYSNQAVFVDSTDEYDVDSPANGSNGGDIVILSNNDQQTVVAATTTQYCKRCKIHMDPINQITCLFCERKRNNLPINEEFCLNCGKPLKLMNERENGSCLSCRNTNFMCGFCQKNIDICPNCNAVFCLNCHQKQQQQQQQHPRRSQDSNHNDKIIAKQIFKENIPTHQTNHQYLIGKKRTINKNSIICPNKPKEILFQPTKKSYKSFEMIFDESTDQEIMQKPPPPSSTMQLKPSVFVRNDNKPYSTNVDQNSLFHPTKRIDTTNPDVKIFNSDIFIEDLDAKFANYARNYSILSEKPTPPLAQPRPRIIDKSLLREKVHFSDFDSYPLPLMPPPRPPQPSIGLINQVNGGQLDTPKQFINKSMDKPESLAVKQLKQKWEVPVIQKNVLTNSNQYSPSKNRVLTQLGAIRKQLQLEQLELDKTLPKSH